MSRTIKTNLFLLLGGLGLVMATSAARAQPCNMDAGFHFNMQSYGCQATLGPWYSYFPYEAHFQVPAPVCPYPNWPTPFPGTANPQQNQGSRMTQAPVYPGWQLPNMQAVGYQPGGYPYGMPLPYGYGR